MAKKYYYKGCDDPFVAKTSKIFQAGGTQAVAKKYKITKNAASQLVVKLRRECGADLFPRIKQGRPYSYRYNYENCDDEEIVKLSKLWKSGSSKAIADELFVSEASVQKLIQSLRKYCGTDMFPYRETFNNKPQKYKFDEETILPVSETWIKDGYPGVMKIFDISQSRATQVVGKLREVHGEDLFPRPQQQEIDCSAEDILELSGWWKQGLSLIDIGQLLNITDSSVSQRIIKLRKLCGAEMFPVRRKGHGLTDNIELVKKVSKGWREDGLKGAQRVLLIPIEYVENIINNLRKDHGEKLFPLAETERRKSAKKPKHDSNYPYPW